MLRQQPSTRQGARTRAQGAGGCCLICVALRCAAPGALSGAWEAPGGGCEAFAAGGRPRLPLLPRTTPLEWVYLPQSMNVNKREMGLAPTI